MLKTKSKWNKIFIVVTACVLLCTVVVVITLAFFGDKQTAENILTIGNVKLSLVEQNFPKDSGSKIMYSGSFIPKDPKIINTGNNNEYVYMSISVPLEKVTLLNEKGEKPNDSPKLSEIFKLISADENAKTLTHTNYNPDIKYNPDWIYLGASDNSVISETENTEATIHTYIFAYKKELLSSNNTNEAEKMQTSTLFDKIQLRSFIEGEIPQNKIENIEIKAYGIQSDNLVNVDLPTDSDTDEQLKTKLTNIFNIYANQNGVSKIL